MMTRSALPEQAGIPKSKIKVSHALVTVVTASTSPLYGDSSLILITVPTGSVVYTFMERTLVLAMEKFNEDTEVILPPAHMSATLTLTILATLALLFPTELGLETMAKEAPSYPCIPEVVDSKSKGRDCAQPNVEANMNKENISFFTVDVC